MLKINDYTSVNGVQNTIGEKLCCHDKLTEKFESLDYLHCCMTLYDDPLQLLFVFVCIRQQIDVVLTEQRI